MASIYYDRDGIRLYHGDAIEAMSSIDGPVDAIVTDPPYASGARTEAAKASSGAMVRGQRWAQKPIENDQMTTTGFVWLIRETLLEGRRLLVDGGSVLSFIDWRQWPNLVGAVESCNLRVNGMLVWDKASYGLGSGFRAQHELILHASKGTASIAKHDQGNVLIAAKRETAVDHPSPKPVGLMEQLLRVVADRGALVLDPFAGAGATLVAARNLGMRAIGVESEEAHCETIAKRLDQQVLPLLGVG